MVPDDGVPWAPSETGMCAQVLPAALLWGTGTAIGEIPPYAFSYHAAKAGIRNEEWDSMFEASPKLDFICPAAMGDEGWRIVRSISRGTKHMRTDHDAVRHPHGVALPQVKPAREGQGFFEGLLNRMKAWMLGFIQRCAPLFEAVKSSVHGQQSWQG